jgi:DNA adenine methylase
MQYLGGKHRIAKTLVGVMKPRGPWLEPFFGGLHVTTELGRTGYHGIALDAQPALVFMVQALQEGWLPPTSISEAEYKAAKLLPDTDPLKAFCGFGCSFGGKWFGGYARRGDYNFASACSRALLRQKASLPKVLFCNKDFLSLRAVTGFDLVYCDPPYEGTTPYTGTQAFSSTDFWCRCQDWANTGARVFVSEYSTPPVPHLLVWEKEVLSIVSLDKEKKKRTERLFRIWGSL